MSTKKTYRIISTYSRTSGEDRVKIVQGTVDELTKYFSYTLEIGHSHNSRIKLHPKTIDSFLVNVQEAFLVKEGACYNRTYIDLLNEKYVSGMEELIKANQADTGSNRLEAIAAVYGLCDDPKMKAIVEFLKKECIASEKGVQQ